MVRLQPVADTRQQFGGVSVMTDYRRRRDGLLPAAIKINGRNYDRAEQIAEIQQAVIAGTPAEQIQAMVRAFNADNAAGVIEREAA